MKAYVSKKGRQYGPYPLEKIEDFVESGRLSREDFVCHDGAKWITVDQLLSGQTNPEMDKVSVSKPKGNPVKFLKFVKKFDPKYLLVPYSHSLSAFKRCGPIGQFLVIVGSLTADVLNPIARFAPWLFFMSFFVLLPVGYKWLWKEKKKLQFAWENEQHEEGQLEDLHNKNKWCVAFSFLSISTGLLLLFSIAQLFSDEDERGFLGSSITVLADIQDQFLTIESNQKKIKKDTEKILEGVGDIKEGVGDIKEELESEKKAASRIAEEKQKEAFRVMDDAMLKVEEEMRKMKRIQEEVNKVPEG